MSSRPWWIAQFVLGGTVLAVTIVFRVGVALGWFETIGSQYPYGGGPPLAPTFTFGFIYPGLALSLAVNGLLMRRRSSRVLGLGERELLLIEFVAIVVLGVAALAPTGLQNPAGLVSVVLWIGVLALAPAILLLEIANRRAPTRPGVRRP